MNKYQKQLESNRRSRERRKLTSYPLIYKIICHSTGLIYYGSTCDKLFIRKSKHIYDYKNHKGLITAHQVMENNNWEIIEIEKVDDKSKLKQREQYYISNFPCVNSCNAVKQQTQKEIKKKYWNKHNHRLNFEQNNLRSYHNSCGDSWKTKFSNNILWISPDLFT